MKRPVLAAIAALAVVLAGAGSALAVSDGNYSSSKQHCSGAVDNSDAPQRTEQGCHNATFTVSDGSGHEYAGVGNQQVADGQSPISTEDVWVDPGAGTRVDTSASKSGVSKPQTSQGTAANPGDGVGAYFGADDNLDGGEHDSSSQVNKGPSDGGGMQYNVSFTSFGAWLNAIAHADRSYLLTHPLPFVDAGIGECADGICTSVQTQRRVIMQGGDKTKHRDVANYDGKQWDPESCAGPSDTAKDCGGKPLKSWYRQEGTVYAEPGVQFYEDPDPQGSPAGPSYPLPGAYAGTCGVVAGGGNVNGHDLKAPASPVTNGAGQVVVSTGCN